MALLTWRVGDITISRLVEMAGDGPGGGEHSPLPEAYPETLKRLSWLIPDFVTEEGYMRFSVHALLVDTPDGRLIVDTCVGNDKTRAMPMWNKLTTSFLEDLKAHGWRREAVDGVLCTHLHVDHVGWNTMLDGETWAPTFPNARYYMARAEVEHWRGEMAKEREARAPETGARSLMESEATFLDSVKPILDAGLDEQVETDAIIMPGVRLMPTPGHTPGHVSVILESKGERAVITGDLMHHPCQIAHPHWSSVFDTDAELSMSSRLSFFAEFADTGTLVIGTHFGGPTAGHITRHGEEFRFAASSAGFETTA